MNDIIISLLQALPGADGECCVVISPAGVDVKKLMTPEEKAKLYAAIGYDEEDVDPNLPKQVIRCSSCKHGCESYVDKPANCIPNSGL